MNEPTLKQLEAFYWAGACGSFSIAADKLHISQSTLSKRLAELEMAIEQPLFDRTGRKASLTPHGLAMLPRVRNLLNQSADLAAALGKDVAIKGRCRLGVGEIAASSWLPKLVASLRELYPELTLEPFVDLGLELEAKLVSGKLDAAMISRRTSHPALDSVMLASVDYVWVVAGSVDTKNRCAEELVEFMPVVSMSRHAGSTSLFDSWRLKSRAQVLELIEFNSMVTMAGLIAAGLAVGYLPRGWLNPLLTKRVLKVVPSHVALPALNYRFYWRVDDSRPLITKLREIALKIVDYDTPLLML